MLFQTCSKKTFKKTPTKPLLKKGLECGIGVRIWVEALAHRLYMSSRTAAARCLMATSDLAAGFSFLVALAVICFVALNKLLTFFVPLSLHRKV